MRLYEKLITEDKVDAVMGPYSSPVTEAVANVTEKYKKVMVAPLAATTSIFKKGRKYIFMVISPAEVYLEGLVDMAAKRGLKTIAIVNEDTLFSKAAAAGAVELAKKKGMQVVFTEAYPKGNTDFSAMLTKIKAANPDVVVAATYFDDAVALTRQMKELNVNPKMYGVTVGGDLPEFYDTLKQNAEYIYGATQWEPTLPYPGNQEFFETYKKEFGHEPSYHSAAGYAGCLVYAEAVKRADTLDADKVREQLLEARDQDDLRRLQGRSGRLPARPQDGDLPVAGREEGHGVAGRAGPGQAALPDAALDPALSAVPAARERRRDAGDGRAGPHLRRPVRRALRDGGAGAGPHLRGDARHQHRPRAAAHAGRLHHVLPLQPGRDEPLPDGARGDGRAVRGRACSCSARSSSAWSTRPSCPRCC